MRKIAIVGFATTSREQTPKDAGEYELWGMNTLGLHMNRPWTRWFEMHGKEELLPAYPQSWNSYRAWLQKQDMPIYMHEVHEEIPSSVAYPIEEVSELLGHCLISSHGIRYYCSTVAYALALAIHECEKGDEIHLYGIDMVGDDEYGYQRPNAEWLVGYAMGKGIGVYIPPQSALLTAENMYGKPGELTERVKYQTMFKRRALEVDRQQKDLLEENKQILGNLYKLDGMKEALNETLEIYVNHNGNFEEKVKKIFPKIEEEHRKQKQLLDDCLRTIHACDGAKMESDYYLGRLRSIARGGSPLLVEMEPSGGGK